MNIALCGPASLRPLATHQGVDASTVPEGMGPTPLASLIVELLARQHRVTLYTLSHDIEHEVFFDWGALRVFVGPSARFGAARTFYHRERAYLKRVISGDAPSFVHCHWTYEFTLGALAAKVRTLVTIHDLPWNVLRYFRDRCRLVRLLLAYAVALQAKNFTCVSEAGARHFSRYMRPGAIIKVIPNFVSPLMANVCKETPTHPLRPLVFATILQGWTRQKNPIAALRAFARLRAAVPGVRLTMVGTDYAEEGPAHRWARTNDCSEAVTFVGIMPNAAMLEFIRDDVDAVIIPSRNESFSMVALEALSLGKPVIAGARTPGMRSVLDHGRAGLLVDVRSPQAIASAMLALQSHPLLYNTLADRGRNHANSSYSASGVVASYEQLYRELARA